MRPPIPRISIVMPSLNQADFITAAVRSVMSQGIEDLELVIADGGSTDGTQHKLAALAEAYPGRLRWRSGPDGGPAPAINQAVRLARAPVLGWLNSDDLYLPGAVARALGYFEQHPDHVMVYGQGEHVDLFGASMGLYPTLGPDTPLDAFAQGCFICQPTIFIRREAWLAQGGLDESLGASFDFEMWLRVFKAYPGRIGFIDAVQAQSRLHAGGITLRMRERVALEGLTVLRRHLGRAPLEWLLTHVAERCEQHPFLAERQDLRAEIEQLQQRAAPLLDLADQQALRQRLAESRALQLATPELCVPVYPDGWAPPALDVRWRQPPTRPARALRLRCRHSRPGGGLLTLELLAAGGAALQRLHVPDNGEFVIELELSDARPDARQLARIRCLDPFVPAEYDARSGDRRALAYLVEGCEALY
jgi:Glycosyl transferase family 2